MIKEKKCEDCLLWPCEEGDCPNEDEMNIWCDY